MTSTLEGCVAAYRPAFGYFGFPADGQHKVGFILHVPHVIGVGLITHVTVLQFRLRSRKGVLHARPDGIVAPRQISFEFHPGAHAEVIVVLAVHSLIIYAGSFFPIAVLP